MITVKAWVKRRVAYLIVFLTEHALGAKVARGQAGAQQFCPPCPNYYGDVVEIAGRPIHVAQLKRIENEWVEKGLIR